MLGKQVEQGEGGEGFGLGRAGQTEQKGERTRGCTERCVWAKVAVVIGREVPEARPQR